MIARAGAAVALLCSCLVQEELGKLPAADAGTEPAADAEIALACTEVLPCYAPLGERVTVCGQLFDVATRAPLRAEEPRGYLCNPLDPTLEGPCSLCANVFETAELVADPTAANPLDSAAIEIDDCGRYRIVGALLPEDGSLAVLTGNCAMPHPWTPTIATVEGVAGERVVDQPIYAAARTTIQKWTDSANASLEPGQTFSDVGAYLVMFFGAGEPAAGVTVTVSGRPAAGAFYFGDPDPDTPESRGLHTIDPNLTATGATGSALAIGTGFSEHGGIGGEPDGCVWPGALAASVPGALFVDRELARNEETGDLCTPSEIFGTGE